MVRSIPPSPRGPYQPTVLLGLGAHGEVWRASGPEAIEIALKIASNDAARENILREAELLRKLQHPYVVGLVDVEAHGEWLALELIEGSDLGQPIDWTDLHEKVEFVAKLIEGVAHLHDNDIVHGDLKPANVLVDLTRSPKLIDLGVAGLDERTEGGGFRGTLGFASPEQLRGDPMLPASDVYALGVIAYTLITGVPPFKSRDRAALGWLPLTTLPEPVSSLVPEVPAALDNLILELMARQHERRPQASNQLAESFRQAAVGPPGKVVVGRRRERETLRRIVVHVAEGTGAVVVIHGPPGCGRSTLRDEVIATAERERLPVYRAAFDDDGIPSSRDELLDRLKQGASVLILEPDDPELTSLVTRIISRRRPTLVVIVADRPIAPLLSLGARHISPAALSVDEVGLLLRTLDEDPKRAQEVHRLSRGVPGAIEGLLKQRVLPVDINDNERRLLVATSQGPQTIASLAEEFDMTEHQLLDLADSLLDRGLLIERKDGRALERSG